MNTKTCRKCNIIKPLTEFRKRKASKDGLAYKCKICVRNYDKTYRTENVNKCRASRRAWRVNNKEKDNSTQRHRRKENSWIRVRDAFSVRLRQSLKNNKTGNTFDLVPYTLEELQNHLEDLFVDDMTWDNFGKWNIDHIVPCALLRTEDTGSMEFKVCWSLKNLRPLWASANKKKKDRLLKEDKEISLDVISPLCDTNKTKINILSMLEKV